MDDIKAALVQYNTAMDALENAEKNVQLALQTIKTAAGSSTVNVEGQFFQVRERREKLYLCELSGKPRGRPVGSKNSKPRKGSKLPEAEASDLPPIDYSNGGTGLESAAEAENAEASEAPVAPVAEVNNVIQMHDTVEVAENTGIRAIECAEIVNISSDSPVDSATA